MQILKPIYHKNIFLIAVNVELIALFISTPGTTKLQIRGRADFERVLPRHPRWKGCGTELEEVYLQGDLAARRPRAGILQVAELSRATGVNATSTRRTPFRHNTKL